MLPSDDVRAQKATTDEERKRWCLTLKVTDVFSQFPGDPLKDLKGIKLLLVSKGGEKAEIEAEDKEIV